MKRVLFLVLSFCFSLSSFGDSEASSTLAKEVAKEAFSLSGPTLTAIDVVVSEGISLCSIPTPNEAIGLQPPGTYSSKIVQSVSYDKCGRVTIQFQPNSGLPGLSGKLIKLWSIEINTPGKDDKLYARLVWFVDPASTVPADVLSQNPYKFKIVSPNSR